MLYLRGPYMYCAKVPDFEIIPFSFEFPVLAVEVGVTDNLKMLRSDAQKWLRGTNGTTQVVILVHVQERPPINSAQQTKESESRLTWGLSENQIREFERSNRVTNLAGHNIEWHRENKVTLIGTPTADISLISQKARNTFLWVNLYKTHGR
jgi:hypothetical protein